MRIAGMFNRDSILPSIIELEKELDIQEKEALKLAEEKKRKAKLEAEKIMKDTIKELPLIEQEERKRLLEEVSAKTEDFKNKNKMRFLELEQNVERNRKSVLDHILKKLIP